MSVNISHFIFINNFVFFLVFFEYRGQPFRRTVQQMPAGMGDQLVVRDQLRDGIFVYINQKTQLKANILSVTFTRSPSLYNLNISSSVRSLSLFPLLHVHIYHILGNLYSKSTINQLLILFKIQISAMIREIGYSCVWSSRWLL